MSAADRKAEIERKKATLIAIRENRKKREESRRSGLEDGSAAELGKVASNGDLGQTTEEILKTLGIPVGEEPVGTQNATDAQDSALAAAKTPTTTRKRKHLQFSRIIESSVPPPQSIQYSKEVQTIAQLSEREILTYEETSREEEDVDASAALAELQKMPHVGLSQTSQKGRTRLENGVAQEEVKKPVNLSEEDKTRILSSDDFIQFFNRSAQIIERAICEPEDALFLDYTGGEREAETSRELVTVCHEFFDERWSKRRVVTSLEWSTIYPELLLAAYHINEEAAHEPEGVCLIWNMKFPKKTSPEFIFHCQSPITSATLSKFHPNLVIGGTYSGQIVLWDSRVNKRTPVQRSPLTSMAHTHPVFAVTVVGTQNAHNIISLGSDGSLCAWNIEMLAQPREKSRVCEVPSATGGGHFELYPTCMSFFANDVNNYAVGAENGNAYCGQRHSSRTATTDDASRNVPYKGHCAPITAISTHPCPGAMNFSSLFLTSSLDWTVRLWSTSEYTPLHTFEDYFDYVYDVSWSPVHPAVFAAVDGTGRLDVWNINQDVEVPCARHSIRGHTGQDRTGGNIALNKCRWDSSGSYLAAGDNQGRVTICSVHESLSQPGPEQWSELARSLTDLKHYKMEQEVGRAEM
ncbi:hypothetical protein T265_15099 [Opisthorchis viverrini]|uniref:Uncharacterized protein n=2 Tax=Opisthorchis viverrini TaxID=6198 RepID=A0A075A1Y4_OPIVI|nr:hypothetical protein T265_15099 [Opisthorchis viverrini]KER21419.1 hypothetical protein T265_15099 [Opisthorchis viverrini]